jgi:glutamyl-tRNA reductase
MAETTTIIVLAVHARDVPSAEREAFAAAAASIARDARVLVLRTCHRVEVYAVLDQSATGDPLALPHLPRAGRRLEGLDAVRHVFACAAGLDSVVVGEDQVLHQLRECVAERHSGHARSAAVMTVPSNPAHTTPSTYPAHTAPSAYTAYPADPAAATDPAAAAGPRASAGMHPVLERLMQTALHVGRVARSRRDGPPPSLADVAVDDLSARLGSLDRRRILIVGAGPMARLAGVAASGHGADVLVSNRSRDRAAALAHEVHGQVVEFGPPAALPTVDGILLAIAGPWLLSPPARAALVGSAIPLVDLSSPPALDQRLRDALGPRYTSIDDLARRPRHGMRARARRALEHELARAETDFTRWLSSRDAVPAIAALRARAEQQRVEELDRLFRRTDLASHERELVEQMSRRLVAGLLHRPIATLRDDADGELERATRSLFAL